MMITMRTVFFVIIISNFLALIMIGHYYSSTTFPLESKEILTADIRFLKTDPYSFKDQLTAYYVLQELDVFEPIEDKYFNYMPKLKNNYHIPFYGMKNDDLYCVKHRAYFVDHPEFIFQNKNFILDYPPNFLVRKVIKDYGKDIQPNIGAHLPKRYREKFFYDIRPDVNIFFTNEAMNNKKHLGKHFSCITQASNHILGQATLNRKDYAAASVVKYAKLYESKPECFNFTKFFPKTWVLKDKEQCKDFFKNQFNGPEYERLKEERTVVYIRKVGAGSHQGKGVQPVNENEEGIIRKVYKNGKLCGKVNKSTIIQTYIHNPLLLDNHKFDFRIYMLIASTNPILAYYYDGFLRVSLHPYDVNSNDKGVLLTNTALSNKIFDVAKKEGTYQGLTEKELRDFQMWNFTRLHYYLLEKGYTTDLNWVDNYLRPEFKKAMIHLVRMAQGPFLRRSETFEVFGVDFMLDTDLNLWFIECNSGPVLSGATEQKKIFITKMLKDQFEIIIGLVRSRTKRIIEYVNRVIEDGEIERLPSGQVKVKDLEAKRLKFNELIKNYFEPEFEPSPDNGFFKIIDENLKGTSRYAGLIRQECLFENDF